MESEARIIQMFKELGIKAAAAKAYLALLRIGPSTATRTSRSSGIPHPRTYDVMNYLQKKGFVEVQKIGRRNIYRALKPEIALNRLTNDLRSKAASLGDSLRKIEKIDKTTESPQVWLIKEKSNIMAKIYEIVDGSEVELLIAVSAGFVSRKLLSSLRDATRRSVSISLVFHSGSDVPLKESDPLKEWASIRQSRVCLTNTVMADNRCALFLSTPMYAVYTEDPNLLHVLGFYFYNFMWMKGEPITKEEAKARNFAYIWRAIEVVEVLMKEGKEVRATVRGTDVKTGKETRVEGTVRGTVVEHPTEAKVPLYSIVIENAENKEIKVGGPAAIVEDVAASQINLEVRNRQRSRALSSQ